MKKYLLTVLAFVMSITLLVLLNPGKTLPMAAQGLPTSHTMPDPFDSPTHTTDAQNVELVGQIGGLTLAIFAQGNYAYVGEGP